MKTFILLMLISFNTHAWIKCENEDGSVSFGAGPCFKDPNKGIYITDNVRRNIGNIITRDRLVKNHRDRKKFLAARRKVRRVAPKRAQNRDIGANQGVMAKAQRSAKGGGGPAPIVLSNGKVVKPHITGRDVVSYDNNNQATGVKLTYSNGHVITCGMDATQKTDSTYLC